MISKICQQVQNFLLFCQQAQKQDQHENKAEQPKCDEVKEVKTHKHSANA